MAKTPITIEQARALKNKLAGVLEEIPEFGVGICRVGEGYGVKLNLYGEIEDTSAAALFARVPIVFKLVGPIRALKKKPKSRKS